ncbi:MAG: hypothetical protein KAR45_21180, partial [Desulfobacteraceae bacterium]|nr:hypothetical protein [Desulfobacteraceae bacterium]
MTYKIIQELVEKLSLEFVLTDLSEPETLSELLPILNEIYENSMELSLETLPDKALSAENIVKNVALGKLSNIEKDFESLNTIISEMETLIHALKNAATETAIDTPVIDTNKKSDNEETNETQIEKVEESLEKFSRLIAGFCPGEIPDLGAMLNVCDEVVAEAKSFYPDTFEKVALSCKEYLTSMTLENIENTQPIEEGVTLLKALLQHIKTGKEFAFDISDVVELLTKEFAVTDNKIPVQKLDELIDRKEETGPEPKQEHDKEQGEPEKVSDEDLEILVDFISEATENLDSIEISLLELEHDPTDNEIINN